MKREAILHIPMSNYAHGIDENHIIFRLRSARGDLKYCRLYYGDRSSRINPIIFSCVPMEVTAQDEYFDYYEVVLECNNTRISYYFELNDGFETILYYSGLFQKHKVENRSEYYQFPYNRKENIARIPEWVKNAVIYNIFPDSFATSRRFISKKSTKKEYQGLMISGKNGGTIRGITENIDYLIKLGINCIYINPIFAAESYHKYDLLDYFHIDPCFGTDDDFIQMVNSCHEQGIRVIIDAVFNHCGWNFFAFNDIIEKGEESRYKDWFYRLAFPVVKPDNMEDIPSYECFGYERTMPKMNTSNPEVKKYFLEVCRYWLEKFDIDGWRLDVADEIDDDFWREFRKTAKSVKPDCFIIGEVWQPAEHWLQGDQFDSTMNYDFRKNCSEFFATGSIDAYQFDGRVSRMRKRYRRNMVFGQLNLLDSHDCSRFLSLCKGNLSRFKLAVIFQMTFIGPPSVLYGDEQQLAGLKEDEYRSPMRWNENNEMFLFYQALIALRKKYDVLRLGDYRTVLAQTGSRLYSYERYLKDTSIMIALNTGDQDIKFNLSLENRDIIMKKGFNGDVISPYGYIIAK